MHVLALQPQRLARYYFCGTSSFGTLVCLRMLMLAYIACMYTQTSSCVRVHQAAAAAAQTSAVQAVQATRAEANSMAEKIRILEALYNDDSDSTTAAVAADA